MHVRHEHAALLLAFALAACGDDAPMDTDLGGPPCSVDTDCDNGLFCDGVETCELPADGGEGVCVTEGSPCRPSQMCDEEAAACTTPCDTDADCTVASEVAGFPETCLKHFCTLGFCEERPEGAEACDGWDNDCDGLVDEAGAGSEGPWRESESIVANVPTTGGTEYGVLEESVVALWAEGSSGSHATVDVSPTPDAMSYLRESGTGLELEAGCVSGSGGPGSCTFGELAAAPAGDHELIAAVTTNGCAQGRLLIGHSPPVDPVAGVPIVLRGGDEGGQPRSNTVAGVDAGGDACSGSSRAGCAGAGDGCGAARPALAAIEHGGSVSAVQSRSAEAAMAWLGDSTARAHCGGAAVPVEAMVVHLLRKEFGDPYFWVTGSNGGVPNTLGQTSGGGGPAVLSWGSRGWVIGFGNTSGELALHWIPSQSEPPDVATGTPVPAIEGLTELGSIATDGAPDHLALSLGAIRADGLHIGAAWLEGCGEGEQRIVFQHLLAESEGVGLGRIVAAADAVVLATESTTFGPPSITYAPRGMVVEGFERSGATADDTVTGGWTIGWTRGEDADADGRIDGAGEVRAARVAELDGAPLGEVVTLSASGEAADSPQLTGDRFIYRDAIGEALVGGSLVCTP